MKFIAGELCLDFINTVGARVSKPGHHRVRDYAGTVLRDKLVSYQDLLTWSKLAGLVSNSEARSVAGDAAGFPDDAAAVLVRATTLREVLYRILKSVVEGWRPNPRDLDVLRAELSISRSHEYLAPAAEGFSWVWDDDSHTALDHPLWVVSRSAAHLLTSPSLALLRQCGGTECGWMFLDTSRNRGRQWCDMRICGNRAKAMRFRRRQR